jgi:integrase
MLALQWPDLDLDNAVVTIRRSLQQTPEGLSFKEPKNGLSRRVDLPALAVDARRSHHREQSTQRALLGTAYQNGGLVCCREDGSPWRPESFSPAFAKLARLAGLQGLRFHDLRHGHASQLLKQGIHLKAISERLGHSSSSFTLDRYGHLLDGIQQEAARRMDQALGAAVQKERISRGLAN